MTETRRQTTESQRAADAPSSGGHLDALADKHTQVLVVGAGFAGLGAAIRLLQEGFTDVLVIERESEVGGTWRDNTYPGCACDVPSDLYSFSFAPNPDWGKRFAPQSEIAEYLRRCADRFGVRPRLRLGCELTSARWDTDGQLWQVETSRGPLTADILVMAQGPLSEPAIPRIPGIEQFEGESFHSARWDHSLDLSGLRVGVIGTGASAVQFIPEIQRKAAHLTVFQRTPSWITPRHDWTVPNWRKSLFRRFPVLQRISRGLEYLSREVSVPALMGNSLLRKLGQQSAESHLKRQVQDPVLRAKLTPDYDLGCKRVLLSDNYYPALIQPNVSVVTDPLDSIGARSVRTTSSSGGEVDHDIDVLVFSTGFRVTDGSHTRVVVGADGRSLDEVWGGSPSAYLGTTVAGFPNLFLMAGPNTGLGHNSLIYMIEAQIGYLLSCLTFMRDLRVRAVEVTASVQQRYNDELQRRLAPSVWASGGCSSWYMDATGRITTIWPGQTWEYRDRTATFDPEAYEVTMDERPSVSTLV
ncbi:cation diffusion facilitator CzcD-associated flavoprotein CzcO [Mycobacterium frederiksbergense]|uniref:Cation diffusion facilitator CzcD-associated flavoprotein CzcO n=1 Tax=Mycolicibacterium frederiksbergense TaxID=117567 RepID=A0ABT6L126_9MYCO|nr:NAD(P)/FAD-dependent oxidoreductase [Mycolicibacterium frederiksbergense]MDH6196647.1 cation diffusion facilitator CzcD-associated flavoprotein CzcO [Mycolicibacterium frederiksbergense]